MIDIETRNIIDILESRDFEDVTDWLKTYPNLKIVSRDGSQTYASAIKSANPNSIQINDRFHLLKNLTDYCKKYITNTISYKVEIGRIPNSEVEINNSYGSKSKSESERIKQAQNLQAEGLSNNEISKVLKMDIRTVKKYIELKIDEVDILNKDISQIKHEENVNKKQKRIDEILELYKGDHSIRAILRITGFARKTVKRYLDPDVSAVHASYGTTRKAPLTPFHNSIDELLEKGYYGSASAIRMYTTRKRKSLK